MLFFWMVVTGTVGSGMDVVIPLFQQHAIDHFMRGQHDEGVGGCLALYVLVMLVQTASNYISAYGACKAELSIGRDLKREAFNHLQTLSFSYFNQNSVGYVHARVMSDTDRIASTLAWGMMEGVWYIRVSAVCAIVMMFVLNWKLALCVMVIVPVLAISGVYFQKKLVFFHRRVREQTRRSPARSTRASPARRRRKRWSLRTRWSRNSTSLTGEMKRRERPRDALPSVFMSTTARCVCRAGDRPVARRHHHARGRDSHRHAVRLYELCAGHDGAGAVACAGHVVARQRAGQRRARHKASGDGIRRAATRRRSSEKYGDAFHPKKENWEPLHGDIEFQDVTFRYPDGSENVLEHFNLKVPQGTNVAIVGETGAGKSTLVNLVCRFFEPTEGRVLIDGRDARERSQLWLHSEHRLRAADAAPVLRHGPGKPALRPPRRDDGGDRGARSRPSRPTRSSRDCRTAMIPTSARAATRLSTGEKQLLSFARALLADPRIFVLDEATSSVDTVTERLIQNAIEKVMAGRTSFIIAHRLSTIRRADVILVVHDGKIIESGTHRSLMNAKGAYYQLYTHQYREEQTRSMMD